MSIEKIMISRCKILVAMLALFASIVIPSVARAVDGYDASFVNILVDEGPYQRLCRGVAISNHTVMTAAHCVAEQDAGRIHLQSTRGRFEIETVHVHPGYNKAGLIPHFDIALLTAFDTITDAPVKIFADEALSSGDTFSTYLPDVKDPASNPSVAKVMKVTDTERMVLSYVEHRKDSLPHSAHAAEIAARLSAGDPRIKEHIHREWGNYLFAEYGTNRTSICQGDSGAPALIARNGEIGVIGVATAVADMEAERNPECDDVGGTSIFTSLNDYSTLVFLQGVLPALEF